jgi:hypothetical protein
LTPVPSTANATSKSVTGVGARSWSSVAGALVWRGIRRPTTGLALVRVAWRFRARGWYRRFPFLPLPDRTYVRWRMYTAYGDEGAIPSADDVERYATWAVREP